MYRSFSWERFPLQVLTYKLSVDLQLLMHTKLLMDEFWFLNSAAYTDWTKHIWLHKIFCLSLIIQLLSSKDAKLLLAAGVWNCWLTWTVAKIGVKSQIVFGEMELVYVLQQGDYWKQSARGISRLFYQDELMNFFFESWWGYWPGAMKTFCQQSSNNDFCNVLQPKHYCRSFFFTNTGIWEVII